MTNVLIVYASTFGSTEKMASAMAQAVLDLNNTTCLLKKCNEVTEEEFLDADAILLGCPVKMGSIDWQLKKMIDTVLGPLWIADKLVGKVGACFASGGGFGKGGSGVELTLVAITNAIIEMGILFMPLPKNTQGYKLGGIQWGAYGMSATEDMLPSPLEEKQLEVCKIHAQNVTRIAQKMNGQNVLKSKLEI